ncbi:MAG: anti-sigma factor, partial [Thermoleophilia bacterium]|nr:anti-sigma factor [Thermoleophilia bacterium]
EELAGLREATALLAYGAVGGAPPAELKERILAEARAERPNVVQLPRRRWTPLAAVAAVAAAVALGLGIWAAARPAPSDAFASILAEPGARLVPMGERGALAIAPDGKAALALTVPPAPAGKTYEAWVIRGGRPKRAGVFRGREGTSVIEVEHPVRRGVVVAVTLEQAGGVDRPTGEPLVAGKVT